MTKTERLLYQLDVSVRELKLFINFNKDSLFVNRIKKFLHHPFKVLRVILYKAGLIASGDVSVEMFWEKKLVLPLWEENILIAYYSNSFGFAEIPLVRFFIKNLKESDIFYDVGASFGLYTMLMEELGVKVFSFEPNPHEVKYIIQNANPRIKVEVVAVSDVRGNVTLHDAFGSTRSCMSSFFPDIASVTPTGKYTEISVPTITLDDYITSHELPTVIKIDVMNADYLVLTGGKKLFTLYTPTLAIRMYNTPKALERTKMSLALLKEYGYASYSIKEDGELLPVNIHAESLPFASTFVFKK